MKRAILLGVAFLSAGCYTYTPAPESVAPGTRVRATLTPAGALRRSEGNGEPERRTEGELVRLGEDTLALAIIRPGLEARYARPGFPIADTLHIPQTEILMLEERRLSGKRTALVISGITVGTAILVHQAFEGAGGAGGSREGRDGPLRAVISDLLLRLLRGSGR